MYSLRYFSFIFAFFIIFLSTAQAQGEKTEDEKWKNLYRCFGQHGSNVAATVGSLKEGATLIKETLCLDESNDLFDTMMSERKNFVESVDNISEAFSSFQYLIGRELRGWLYEEKLRQYNKK